MTVKERYQGIQTVFDNANKYACLFLSLLSIAEDYTGKPVDFISAYRNALDKKQINEEFECLDQCSLLNDLTGKKWSKKLMNRLPGVIPDNVYTIERWHNRRTDFTHFKRRGFDTLEHSFTVAEGYVEIYYCYTVED